MSTTATTQEEWKPTRSPWLISAAVMIATFIFVLDSTIAQVALPHMAGSFSASNEEAMWVLTSYLIASGIVLPTVGWFSHIFGRKQVFVTAVIVFTIASVMCGLSWSMETMILSRVLQGFGGGAILPIAQAVMFESFPKEKRNLAMSIFGLGIIIAPVLGPVLGGWLTDTLSWHWIFFINLPFGIIAVIAAIMFLENPPYMEGKGFKGIDYVGFSLLTVWLVTLQVVLDKGQNADWFHAPWICWLSAISVISMIGFFWSQLTNKDAIVDLSVFKDKNFAYTTILLVVLNGFMYASMAIMPLFLQNLLGYSAFWSGYALMPRGIGSLFGIILTGVLNKVDERVLAIIGLACMGASCFMFGNLNLNISMFNIVIPNLLLGFGMTMVFLPLTTLSMATLGNSQMTNASAVQNMVKNVGGAIGTSIVVTMIIRFGQVHQYSMVKHLNPLNPAFAAKVNAVKMGLAQYMHISVAEHKANLLMYSELLRQSNLWAYMDAFRIFGVLALILVPLVFTLDKNKKDPDSEHTVVMH